MIVFSTLMAQKNIFVDFIFLYTFFLLFSSSRNSFNCYAILLWATKNAVTVTYTNTKKVLFATYRSLSYQYWSRVCCVASYPCCLTLKLWCNSCQSGR